MLTRIIKLMSFEFVIWEECQQLIKQHILQQVNDQ